MKIRTYQISRILQVAALIYAYPRRFNRRDLAQRCGVQIRTIQRYINELRQAGIQIDFRDGGYEIISDFFLPSINLNLEEAMSLIVSAKAFANNEGQYCRDTLEMSIAKITANLPQSVHKLLGDMPDQVDISSKKISQDNIEKNLASLHDAIRWRTQLRMEYNSFQADKRVRHLFNPYGTAFRKRAWYVVGLSETYGQILTFRVNRIYSLYPTFRKYEIPEDFSIREHFEKCWNVISGPETQVVVKFSPRVAELIEEVKWHPTQQIEKSADGSLIFKVTVAGTLEISWWILSYGDDAEVLEPESLRKQILEIAQKIVEKYQ